MGLLFFYLSLALFVSFLCSVLEAVLLSITPSYIASMDDNSRVKVLLEELKSDIDTSISSILILNTIAHTMGAAGVGAEAVRIFGVQWQSLIAIILTLLILYFSEIIPKTIGVTYWRQLAKPTAYIIKFLTRILLPLLWVSHLITQHIQKPADNAPTREEIAAMAEMSEEHGILAEEESQLIENLLQLKQVKVEDILTPRSVVFALDGAETIQNALAYDDLYIFSRIPVFEQTPDNITGLVFARTILKAASQDRKINQPLKEIMTPIHRVPKDMPVYQLMDQFIRRKEHLFLVHDSYLQYSGIVTLEDALEALLGREIVDEADKVADMQQYALEKAAIWKQQLKKRQAETGGQRPADRDDEQPPRSDEIRKKP
ncbi:CBS domain containing-hemolysin-like protein [Geothermobacter ehrlichii]|uniref:CBS domain containing-hemolysin-like protein n=1 Tax=Geothermobacter ehrlichii TaxID=213224 RepID=A0A5D3WMF1_9BACT|nr:CNNM domain-containing protein [Geothermobacter ehrlichii]TYP00356.1 CBS domain containing-hemolysin-like protein [Geothermobacter ehrlichii]